MDTFLLSRVHHGGFPVRYQSTPIKINTNVIANALFRQCLPSPNHPHFMWKGTFSFLFFIFLILHLSYRNFTRFGKISSYRGASAEQGSGEDI